jgi:hypothetical protein
MSKPSNNDRIFRTRRLRQERSGHVRRQSPFLRMSTLISTIIVPDTADPDDPNELSFSKGDIFDIIDKTGNWWQAETEYGTRSMSYLRVLADSYAWLLIPSCSYPFKLCPNRRQEAASGI